MSIEDFPQNFPPSKKFLSNLFLVRADTVEIEFEYRKRRRYENKEGGWTRGWQILREI